DFTSGPDAGKPGHFPGIKSYAPAPTIPSLGMASNQGMYYPYVNGGGRQATQCTTPTDCSAVTGTPPTSANLVCANLREDNCEVTVLDHYTTSFNWAETNFSAIWLRPQWYLVTNSVITDVQQGGISFITSGDYSRSSAIPGIWSVMRDS